MTDHRPDPPTPFLRLDLDRAQRNIHAMAALARGRGIALRPHAKTHKSPELAARQLAAGAVGLTVATVGEAEVFSDAGCTDLVIAYPLWVDAPKAHRLAAVMERARVAVGIDSRAGVDAMALQGIRPELLVEVDSGHHRTGVSPSAAGELARYAADAGFAVRGIFTFPGHSYSPTGREQSARDEDQALGLAADSLRSVGVQPGVVSGGSTPSAAYAGAELNELRPGVYVFGDAQQVELGACGLEDVALTVCGTVVAPARGRVVIDAGRKALSAARAPWARGRWVGLALAAVALATVAVVGLGGHAARGPEPAPRMPSAPP